MAQVSHFFHSFSGSDGANSGGLIASSDTLYGATANGGSSTNGIVFNLNTDGSGFSSLHSFTGGGDGAQPVGLLLSGNNLYGITRSGGDSGNGTVFVMNINGTGFRTVCSLSDVVNPRSLVLFGNTLFGTAVGAFSNYGTVFAVNTDGTGFTNLYSFTGGADGKTPHGLVLGGNTFYGTTAAGGAYGSGTVFSISLPSLTPPPLTITAAGENVILTWPTSANGFTLQTTTNLGPSMNWTTNLPAAVVLNGNYTVTSRISGTQQFFRLSQ
jgi:uncharacterized repeat protein (TIGR03803 family)